MTERLRELNTRITNLGRTCTDRTIEAIQRLNRQRDNIRLLQENMEQNRNFIRSQYCDSPDLDDRTQELCDSIPQAGGRRKKRKSRKKKRKTKYKRGGRKGKRHKKKGFIKKKIIIEDKIKTQKEKSIPPKTSIYTGEDGKLYLKFGNKKYVEKGNSWNFVRRRKTKGGYKKKRRKTRRKKKRN